MSYLRLICFLAFVILICSITSCENNTSPKNGSLHGIITLAEQRSGERFFLDNNSGIAVALYCVPESDSIRDRVSSNYPNIGSELLREHEFDHRIQNSITYAITDAQGGFVINDIQYGSYNVAIFKDGWDVEYLYGVIIDSEDTDLNAASGQSNSIVLDSVSYLEGYITSPFTFESGSTYIITSDISMINDVTFESGTKIYVNPGISINIYAKASFTYQNLVPIYISSSNGLYSLSNSEPTAMSKFSALHLRESSTVVGGKIEGLLMSFAEDGLVLNVNNIEISDCNYLWSSKGILGSGIVDITIERAGFYSCGSIESAALDLSASNELVVQNCVFLDNSIALKQLACTASTVQDCYFQGNTQSDVMNLYETIGNVNHCEFRNSNVAIDTSGRSRTTVSYCNIYARIGIFNYIQLNWFASWFTANNNNLYCTDFAARTKAVFWTPYINYLDAKNNFWNTSSSSQIDELIWDQNDEDPDDEYYDRYQGIIEYIPYRNSRVVGAGINNGNFGN